MTRAAPKPLAVDVAIRTTAWTHAVPSAAAHCRKVARHVWRRVAPKVLQARAAELAVVLVTDAAIRKLNAAYRGKDKPTNVLSFPADAFDGPGPALLGDVVVAYATCAREARQEGKSLKNHLSHMVVHGVLHLLGYDHESARDAKTMERLETDILLELGVADPYADPPARVVARPKPRKRSARTRT